jgi:flagellar hook-basal body complex protein FliE
MSGIGGVGGGFSGAGGIREIMQLRQQIIDRSQVLQQVHTPEAPAAPAGGSPAGGFSNALKSALDGVNAVQKRSEELSAGYERGEVTDIAKVMLARQESGVAFEATLQVRNKLLTAYQDIMRMGV